MRRVVCVALLVCASAANAQTFVCETVVGEALCADQRIVRSHATEVRELEEKLRRWQQFWGDDCEATIGGVYCADVDVAQVPCKKGGIDRDNPTRCLPGMETTWDEVRSGSNR